MPSTWALLLGLVNRILPAPTTDNQPGAFRVSRYGELYSVGVVRKQHAVADEGSYFVWSPSTSASPPAGSSFSPTQPFIIVTNLDFPSNPSAKRIHLDRLTLTNAFPAGSASSGLIAAQCAMLIDGLPIFLSGGQDFSSSIVSTNMDGPIEASVAKLQFGNISISSISNNSRTIVGVRSFRPSVSATVMHIAGDENSFNFGGVERGPSLLSSSGTFQPNIMITDQAVPPITIGPGESFLFYVWLLVGVGVSMPMYNANLSWWER